MLTKLKQTKRRAIQSTMQAIGKAEVTTRDEEFQAAVDNFKAMETDLKQILKALLESREITRRYTARNANLGCLLSAYFRGDQGPDSFREPSNSFMEGMTRSHTVVQRSCGFMLQNHVINQIQRLLDESFHAKKKLISQHDGLKTDLESYRRRVKHLQEKGKPGNDPEMIKFSTKLGRTQSAYDRLHADLLSDLRDLFTSRHEMLRPHFTTIVACQGELQAQLANDMDTVMSSITDASVAPVRSDIRQLVADGGPPPDPEEEEPEHSSMIKGITSKLKRSSIRRSQKGAPDPAAGEVGVPAANAFGGVTGVSHGMDPPASQPPAFSTDYAAENEMQHDPSMSSFASGISDPQTSVDPAQSPSEQEVNPFSSDGIPLAQSYDPSNSSPTRSTMDGAAMAASRDSAEASANKVVIALYDYSGIDEHDLSFSKGDKIVVEKEVDEGWWSGRKEDGSVGLFPRNHVKLENE